MAYDQDKFMDDLWRYPSCRKIVPCCAFNGNLDTLQCLLQRLSLARYHLIQSLISIGGVWPMTRTNLWMICGATQVAVYPRQQLFASFCHEKNSALRIFLNCHFFLQSNASASNLGWFPEFFAKPLNMTGFSCFPTGTFLKEGKVKARGHLAKVKLATCQI